MLSRHCALVISLQSPLSHNFICCYALKGSSSTSPSTLHDYAPAAVCSCRLRPPHHPTHATCHRLLPNLLAIWALCAWPAARSARVAFVTYFCCARRRLRAPRDWGNAGAGMRLKPKLEAGLPLIWHRCISRLKLDNSSTRLAALPRLYCP